MNFGTFHDLLRVSVHRFQSSLQLEHDYLLALFIEELRNFTSTNVYLFSGGFSYLKVKTKIYHFRYISLLILLEKHF